MSDFFNVNLWKFSWNKTFIIKVVNFSNFQFSFEFENDFPPAQ